MVSKSNTASRIQNLIVCDLFWTRYKHLTQTTERISTGRNDLEKFRSPDSLFVSAYCKIINLPKIIVHVFIQWKYNTSIIKLACG